MLEQDKLIIAQSIVAEWSCLNYEEKLKELRNTSENRAIGAMHALEAVFEIKCDDTPESLFSEIGKKIADILLNKKREDDTDVES